MLVLQIEILQLQLRCLYLLLCPLLPILQLSINLDEEVVEVLHLVDAEELQAFHGLVEV